MKDFNKLSLEKKINMLSVDQRERVINVILRLDRKQQIKRKYHRV